MFYQEYSTAALLTFVAFLPILIMGIITYFKYILLKRAVNRTSQSKKNNGSFRTVAERVKYVELNSNQFRGRFFSFGLFVSISCCLVFLNWTSAKPRSFEKIDYTVEDVLIPQVIPQIHFKSSAKPIPPPPPLALTEIVPIDVSLPNISLESAVVTEDFDDSENQPEELSPPLPRKGQIENNIPEIRMVADIMPRFKSDNCETLLSNEEKYECAQTAMLKFIYQHIKYPTLAIQNNSIGKAIIQFVVEPDGSLSNIRLLKELKYGMGEEAIRVVELMAKDRNWIAGMQNGHPVRVQFTLPIQFQLR